ncbi:MAG: FG-GAP-like repeat-containing protein [Pyrinomonadaceae bacterium]
MRSLLLQFKGMSAASLAVIVCVIGAAGQSDRAKQDLGRSFRKFDLVRISEPARRASARGETRLQISARGRRMDVDLVPNDLRSYRYKTEDSTAPGVRVGRQGGEVTTFKGMVDGDESSIVRLSIDGPKIEGYLVSGGEKLFVEQARKYTNQADESDYVVYREEDSLVDNTFSCDADAAGRLEAGLSGITAQAATLAPAARILEIATEADYEWVTTLGGASQANSDILSILNMADGVYQSELGIALSVVFQHTWSTPDGFDPTSMSTILSSFGSYWNANISSTSVPRDAAHLFSGKSSARSAGLAWVGVICRSPLNSYGLSGYVGWAPGKYMIPAHEIGHNLNANHVDATQSCASTIMNASLSNTTAFTFCTFSRTEIANFVTANGTCLPNGNPTPTPTPVITPTPTPVITPTPTPVITPTPTPWPPSSGVRAVGDFDGDSRSDIAVWRPGTGVWYLSRSTSGIASFQFGQAGDTAVPADYDGDGRTDAAVYRGGTWHRLMSSTGTYSAAQFGVATDTAVPADRDGDGRADLVVFRPTNGVWYTLYSSSGGVDSRQWGVAGDVPVPADYDGDGRADLNVFRPSNGTWYRVDSSTGAERGAQFGMLGDKPVVGDFDGDRRTDIAVWRPAGGAWYVLQSASGSLFAATFGLSSDIPTVGDYDGDGRADVSVFRPVSGVWYRLNSSTGGFAAQQFGLSGDMPVEGAYVR